MVFWCFLLHPMLLNAIIVQKLTSDNEFLARIFDCWEAGKMFSSQQLDLNLSQLDLHFF